MVKNLLAVLLFLALSPLIIALVVLAMLVVIAIAMYAWVTLRWISWRTGNWHYLVYTSKRGWNDFVTNNLLPALPTGVGVIAILKKRANQPTLAFGSLLRGGFGVAKPYLAQVKWFGVHKQSLNGELWNLKKHAARSEELQRQLRALISKRVCKTT
jgi:hypothetical protein